MLTAEQIEGAQDVKGQSNKGLQGTTMKPPRNWR